MGVGFAGAKGCRVITSIALIAITIESLFIVALVNKLWAIVQLQSCMLEMSRSRIAKLETGLCEAAFNAETETMRLSFRVSKLERAAQESELGDEADGVPR